MQLISQRLCMEKDLGIHGNLFGGIMISWLDESAAIMAYEICHSPNMVTLKIDEVIFTKPVKMGFHLKIYGKVLRLGRSSITCWLKRESIMFTVAKKRWCVARISPL